jgi:hypothetical protein
MHVPREESSGLDGGKLAKSGAISSGCWRTADMSSGGAESEAPEWPVPRRRRETRGALRCLAMRGLIDAVADWAIPWTDAAGGGSSAHRAPSCGMVKSMRYATSAAREQAL